MSNYEKLQKIEQYMDDHNIRLSSLQYREEWGYVLIKFAISKEETYVWLGRPIEDITITIQNEWKEAYREYYKCDPPDNDRQEDE